MKSIFFYGMRFPCIRCYNISRENFEPGVGGGGASKGGKKERRDGQGENAKLWSRGWKCLFLLP